MKWLATLMMLLAGLLGALAKSHEDPRYLSPSEMVVSPDGRRLYVICEKSDELLVVNTSTQKVENRVSVGHVPRGLTLSSDGEHIYVANSWSDTVTVITRSRFSRKRMLPPDLSQRVSSWMEQGIPYTLPTGSAMTFQ
jgi:YVTN family beta-propeller protein